nr:MAG TPA: hypothetical protein [Caudoviricetes sp.]
MNCAKCAEHRAAVLIGAGTAARRSVGGRSPRPDGKLACRQ